MLPKAHLTSHSRMSGLKWVSTKSWLSGLRRSLLCSLCILAISSYSLLLLLGTYHFCPLSCPSSHETFYWCLQHDSHIQITQSHNQKLTWITINFSLFLSEPQIGRTNSNLFNRRHTPVSCGNVIFRFSNSSKFYSFSLLPLDCSIKIANATWVQSLDKHLLQAYSWQDPGDAVLNKKEMVFAFIELKV